MRGLTDISSGSVSVFLPQIITSLYWLLSTFFLEATNSLSSTFLNEATGGYCKSLNSKISLMYSVNVIWIPSKLVAEVNRIANSMS